MAFVTPMSTAEKYDVIVVGSGAAGGQAAYTLTMDGARVLMIEAGRNYDPRTETPMFQTPDQAPLRGIPTPDKPSASSTRRWDGGWSVPGEPYTNASGRRGPPVHVVAGADARRADEPLGAPRAAQRPYDFKPRSRDGLGFDWPISYEDVAPTTTRSRC
jgi:choline dehydrogenase-like flavoprotein